MSDKDRNKKDGRRKEKMNRARREAENPRTETAKQPQQARDISNLTDEQPGAADANRS